MIVASATTFRETFAPVILKKRAARLRRTTGDNRYYAAVERLEQGKSVASTLGNALTRPMRLLAFHPIIQVVAVTSAFNYGLLYIVLATFAELWIKHYRQPVELSGLHYLAIAIGEVVGSQLGGPLMDFQYQRLMRRLGQEPEPESRFPLSFFFIPITAAGLFIYGWTAEYRLHWVVVDIGAFVAMFGLQAAGLPSQAYVIDVYPEHTSSAMAAMQFMRSLTAFLFPLFAPAMYARMGYGWGNSTIAFGTLVLGVPSTFLLWKFGDRLRAKTQSSY